MSQEFVDLESQVRNLEATENELRELLVVARQNSRKAADVLEVHEQLTLIRGQIEQAKGRMRYLSQVAAMSSISLDITAGRESPQPVVEAGLAAAGRGEERVRALVGALQTLATVAIWLVDLRGADLRHARPVIVRALEDRAPVAGEEQHERAGELLRPHPERTMRVVACVPPERHRLDVQGREVHLRRRHAPSGLDRALDVRRERHAPPEPLSRPRAELADGYDAVVAYMQRMHVESMELFGR